MLSLGEIVDGAVASWGIPLVISKSSELISGSGDLTTDSFKIVGGGLALFNVLC